MRQDIAEEKFRPVKRKMQAVWRRIRRRIEMDGVPDAADAAELHELARLMTAYPGFGDARYERFVSACGRLARKARAGDQAAAGAAYWDINRLRDRCHGQGGRKKT